jgi:hypothetical protein
MNRNPTPQQTLQRLPKKWAVAIVFALIAYTLVQPFANSRFGWSLPSLAGVLGMENQAADQPASDKSVASKSGESTAKADETRTRSNQANSAESESVGKLNDQLESVSSSTESETKATTSPAKLPTKLPEKGPEKGLADEKASNAKPSSSATGSAKQAEAKPAKPEAASDLLYGLLKDVGREVYISPAGLRYTRGSEEGHRLKHIEKHLKDIPDRPGKHGVFDGDMAQVLRWIDDGYTRGKQGAKGVRKRQEDSRTVYEVPFTKPIGYVGGRDGKRDQNPDAKRLRLVVDGDQVITAFPF